MSTSPASRRAFLQVLGAGALAACSGTGDMATGRFQVGNVKDLPTAGTVKTSDTQPVAVFRDDGGLYAMSVICTHQQCDMTKSGSVSATALKCDCHGSKFDANGDVITGPANDPLEHYAVEVEANGDIFVDADKVVASDQRTALK